VPSKTSSPVELTVQTMLQTLIKRGQKNRNQSRQLRSVAQACNHAVQLKTKYHSP